MRIAGVNVGKVTDVEPMGKGVDQGAVVSMEIQDKGLPIHTDATAAIRPRIFLEGNFFVDIHPGTPSAPKLGDGDTIRIQNTRTPVQLDQILTSLQSDTGTTCRCCSRSTRPPLKPPRSTGYDASIPTGSPPTRTRPWSTSRPSACTPATSTASSATPARWPTRSTPARRSCRA